MANLKNINLIDTPATTDTPVTKVPNLPMPPEIKVIPKDRTCMVLWNRGAEAGLEKVYLNRIAEQHRQALGSLFLSAEGTRYLDAGCGAGSMFELTSRHIRPKQVLAVDWSEIMLQKARLEAIRLRKLSPDTRFSFGWINLGDPLPWPDNSFDGCVSNQVICYLDCGWKKPLQELARITRPNGYLYLGTLLDNWGFKKVLWKHFLPEFIHAPLISLRGMKCRRILDEVAKEAKKRGAQYPARKELTDYLKTLGFGEIKETQTYWGGSIALRAKLTAKPPS